jgi:hypothetical protein
VFDLESEDIQKLLYCLNDYFSEYGSPEAAAACLRVADRYRWPTSKNELEHLWMIAAGGPRAALRRGRIENA